MMNWWFKHNLPENVTKHTKWKEPKTKNKRKIKQRKICTRQIWKHHEKYILRAWPFTGKVSGCPSKLCRQKDLGPSFSAIMKGPNHKFWNLVCSLLFSCALSHLRTKSPTLKFLSDDELVSNQLFTICWCWSNLYFVCALTSSNFNKAFIRFSKGGQSSSWIFYDNCKEGRKTCGGRMTSLL